MISKIGVRDNVWLRQRLELLWVTYFNDVKLVNPFFIKFGRNSRFRLGSIRLDRRTKTSQIRITAMFKDQEIPKEVVDHTIAHELIHYTHGFSSKRIRMHRYPHAGGVVRKEMRERGMEYLYVAYRKWVKQYRTALRSTHGW